MIALGRDNLLMIHPESAPTDPIVDTTTMRITSALRRAMFGKSRFRGVHHCTGLGCRAVSDNREWFIAHDGRKLLTNSLAIHYVACHRRDVPASMLVTINAIVAMTEPTTTELRGRR